MLLSQSLIAALAIMLLLGVGLLSLLVAEQRRRLIHARLSAVAPSRRGGGAAATGPLRLAQPNESMRGRALPLKLREALDTAYTQTGNRIGPLHTLGVGLAAGGAGLGLTLDVMDLGTPLSFALSLGVAVGAMYMFLKMAQGRFKRMFLDVFPDALDLIIRAVRAGLPVLDAMGIAATEISDPVGSEFRRILEEMRIGFDPGLALQRASERIRIPDFQFFVVSLALQRRTGGGMAETLQNLSNVIRRRKELRVKSRALSAEAKASATVLSLLPVVAFIGLFMLDRPLMSIMFTDPRGRFMLGLGITSQIVGILMIFGLIRRMQR
jgi:tight adherence protein B